MLLQSLLRPVLTPLMRGMFDAPIASSAAWSPIVALARRHRQSGHVDQSPRR
jgi:hypothetical protein